MAETKKQTANHCEIKAEAANSQMLNKFCLHYTASTSVITQERVAVVSNPTSDKTYTCKVHFNGDEVTSKPVKLNVYGRIHDNNNMSYTDKICSATLKCSTQKC